MKIYSVRELTQEIKVHLETSWPEVWVAGEISNLRPAQSGHLYFSLKDEAAQLRAVMFRFSASSLRFAPEAGLAVLASGHLTVYEPRGEYQLIVEHLEPQGIGELQLAFEQLKKKLAGEGLFAPERKRPIPPFPRRIGIVTSPAGAAIRDMIQVLTRRFPPIEILVAPVNVQGRTAAPEIAAAVRQLGKEDVDLILVGRGGGSIEDLWAFNEEEVARAIFESPHPVISAVGHETDFTIADFVADLRAPTPSAAAELAVPVHGELVARIQECRKRLLREPGRRLEEGILRWDALTERLSLALRGRVESSQEGVRRLTAHLRSLNPQAILERGYAIAEDERGRILRKPSQVRIGDPVRVTLAKGRLATRVTRMLG